MEVLENSAIPKRILITYPLRLPKGSLRDWRLCGSISHVEFHRRGAMAQGKYL